MSAAAPPSRPHRGPKRRPAAPPPTPKPGAKPDPNPEDPPARLSPEAMIAPPITHFRLWDYAEAGQLEAYLGDFTTQETTLHSHPAYWENRNNCARALVYAIEELLPFYRSIDSREPLKAAMRGGRYVMTHSWVDVGTKRRLAHTGADRVRDLGEFNIGTMRARMARFARLRREGDPTSPAYWALTARKAPRSAEVEAVLRDEAPMPPGTHDELIRACTPLGY